MAASKKPHPLNWTDTELVWMIKANTDKATGKLMNVASIYRNMGYSLSPRQPVPLSFKQRIEALRKLTKA
jgi:hypothetical protein